MHEWVTLSCGPTSAVRVHSSNALQTGNLNTLWWDLGITNWAAPTGNVWHSSSVKMRDACHSVYFNNVNGTMFWQWKYYHYYLVRGKLTKGSARLFKGLKWSGEVQKGPDSASGSFIWKLILPQPKRTWSGLGKRPHIKALYCTQYLFHIKSTC